MYLSVLLLLCSSCMFTLAVFNDIEIGNSDVNGVPLSIIRSPFFAARTQSSSPNYEPLSESTKTAIVEEQNNGRRNVSPVSSNMNLVVWDDELFNAAHNSTASCRYPSSSSSEFDVNQYVVNFEGITHLASFSLPSSISSWFYLGEYYDYATRTCAADVSSNHCFVYKLLAWAEMTKIGCAQTYCPNLYDVKSNMTRTDVWYFKCNYENVGTYHTDVDAFLAGAPCTACASGSGWCDQGLCDESCTSTNDSCTCEWVSTCNSHGTLDQDTCRCICEDGWSGHNCEDRPQTTIGVITTELAPNVDDETSNNSSVATYNRTNIEIRILNNPCATNNGGCDQVCKVKGVSNRIVCSCWPGYKRDESFIYYVVCVKSAPCAYVECEHVCTDIGPSEHECSCNASYILFYDQRSCVLDVCSFGTYCSMNGLLDEDNCTCHCFSGYTGELCNIACDVDDTECWKDYEPSPVIYYDENVCPVFRVSIGCDQEFNCENGGYLEKESGFEEVSGMCRCYCPFPWSGSSCEDCNLTCDHGTMDYGNCTCSCYDGYNGPQCSTRCRQTSLLCTRHTQRKCSNNLIRRLCPVMCGDCVHVPYITTSEPELTEPGLTTDGCESVKYRNRARP